MQYIYIYIYIVPLYFEWKWFRPLANSPPTSSPRSNRVRLLCDEFAPLYILHYFASLFNRVRPQYIHSYKPHS